MKDKITIAIDAMGGENSPEKNIHGLSIFLKKNKNLKNCFFKLYGNEELIKEKMKKYSISSSSVQIYNTFSAVSDEETPLTAIKNSKNSSMWNTINSQIINESGQILVKGLGKVLVRND